MARDGNDVTGTLDELLALGMDPKQYGSCAQPVDGRVRGCAHWGECKFANIRDANGGKGAGPENFGYYKIRSVGSMDETGNGIISPCFVIMGTDSQLMDQAKGAKMAFSDWILPGEKIKKTYRQRLHPTKNKECHACTSGNCNTMVDVEVEIEVEAFQRPALTGARRSFTEDIKSGISSKMAFEQRVGALVEKKASTRMTDGSPEALGGTSHGKSLEDQVRRK